MKNSSKKIVAAVKDKKENQIENIQKQFSGLLNEPEQFLCEQPDKFRQLLPLLQKVYKLAIASDEQNAKSTEVLPELVLEDMHDEQIWQQLELRNNVLLSQLEVQAAKMVTVPEQKLEIRLDEDDGIDEETSSEEEKEDNEIDDRELEEQENDDIDDDEEDYDEEDDDDGEDRSKIFSKPKVRSSVVDDKFFKLGEMEAFLEAEDAKEMRKQTGKVSANDDDGIDYFNDNLGDGEDEEDENPDYKDFFDEDEELDPKSSKKEKNKNKKHIHIPAAVEDEDEKDDSEAENGADEEQESDDDNAADQKQDSKHGELQPASDSDNEEEQDKEQKPKSSFELRQERLNQRIQDYENEVLGEKPWTLKGEIQATSRPQNSLLEEILEFESTTRPAPVITEATTRCLEDIIRQRIKDKAWDDVVLKVKPIQMPQEYRKKLILDQEKSKLSLAQVYEKEYQNELEKLDPNLGEKEQEEPKEHKEIRTLMRALFVKLDALSNFHFIPKPVAPEPRIITNTPAINMEEVAPIGVSAAKQLAPEEIFKPSKHAPVGKTERNKTDKNRERRKKKNKQRAIHKALEEKDVQKQKMGISLSKKEESAKLLKSVTKHRNVHKITASSDQGSLKSSKAFFSRLQDTTLATASTKKALKKKAITQSLSAKKLKL